MADDDNEEPTHFNPHEDREKRKQVRFEYRELISETEKNRVEFVKPQSRGLHKALDRADELFDNVKQTREAVLDSRFLVLVSKLGRQQAQNLQTDIMKFDPDVFAQKLITIMGGRSVEQAAQRVNSDDDNSDDDVNDISVAGTSASSSRSNRKRLQNLDWKKLGKMAKPSFKRTPSLTFMFGPLSVVPPTKKTKKAPNAKNDKPTLADKVTPKQLDKLAEVNQETTSREYNRIYRYLAKAAMPSNNNDDYIPVDFFKFIVNPHSFSQTIENMFHLAFLIKDGRARVDLDDDTGLPFVVPCEPYQEGQCSNQVMRKQVITNFSFADFKEIIEVFDIKEPMIPSRPLYGGGASSSQLTNGHHEDHTES